MCSDRLQLSYLVYLSIKGTLRLTTLVMLLSLLQVFTTLRVEDRCVECFTELVIKMSENVFRPVFLKVWLYWSCDVM